MLDGNFMEKLLKVSLSEIRSVRVFCRECGTGMDIAVDRLGTAPLTCPACRKELRRPDENKALTEFASSLQFLQRHTDLAIQFIVPLESDSVA